MTQDSRRDVYQKGIAAQGLLDNPLIKGFIENRKKVIIERLESPDIRRTASETESLVLGLQALKKLELELKAYVQEAELQRVIDER